MRSPTTIISNFKSLGSILAGSKRYEFIEIRDDLDASRVMRLAKNGDIIVLDNSYEALLKLCAYRWLFPWRRCKLVTADLNLPKPAGPNQLLRAALKSLLFKRVDLFALIFKDSRAYQHYYRIDPNRIRYLKFKVNGWETMLKSYQADPCAGSYAICAGQTRRDRKTFLEAMRLSGLPGVLLVPKAQEKAVSPASVPANVKLVVHDDGREETFIKWIVEAALVVIPRFSNEISPNGISVYLTAMAAWRCVILTKGSGAEDLLTDGEAILVEPENVPQLATAIQDAWTDLELRRATGLKGRRYAEKMQGQDRYLRDLLAIVNEIDTTR